MEKPKAHVMSVVILAQMIQYVVQIKTLCKNMFQLSSEHKPLECNGLYVYVLWMMDNKIPLLHGYLFATIPFGQVLEFLSEWRRVETQHPKKDNVLSPLQYCYFTTSSANIGSWILFVVIKIWVLFK